jgi:hypothetical protein
MAPAYVQSSTSARQWETSAGALLLLLLPLLPACRLLLLLSRRLKRKQLYCMPHAHNCRPLPTPNY